MTDFRDKFMEGRKVDVGDLLGLDQLQRRVTLALEGGISKVEIEKLYSAPNTFAEFRDEIEKGVGPVRVWIKAAQMSNVEIFNATKGMSASETLGYLSQAEAQSKHIIELYHSAEDSLVTARKEGQKVREEANNAFSRWWGGQGVGTPTGARDPFEMAADYFTEGSTNNPQANKVRERLKQAAAKFGGLNPQPLSADLDELDAAYKDYATILVPGEASKTAFEEFKKKAAMMVDNIHRVQDLEKGLGQMGPSAAQAMQNLPGLQDALKQGEDVMKKTDSQTPQKKLDDLNSSATNFKTSMSQVPDMGLFATNLLTAAAAMDRMSEKAGTLSGFGAVLHSATGGMVWDFLASGGRARGTDTQAAMLSPREIVMNDARLSGSPRSCLP